MPFFYIKNIKDQNVYLCDKPWEFDTSKFPFDLPSSKYKAWWKNENTEGCLLSLNASDYADGAYGTRLDKSTPPRVIYGLSADYDNSMIDESYIARLRKQMPTGAKYAPQWAAISQGRKLHLFWLFEQPVHVINAKHAETFIRYALDSVAAKLFGVTTNDYDAKASECITQYIDIGRQWIPFSPGTKIPADVTSAWSFYAAERTIMSRLNAKDRRSQELPFEQVNELLRRLYPHVNLGEIKEGTRCRRFWDHGADNPTACAATKDGFVVFTPHDNGFMSWVQLFGQDEIDKAVGGSKASIVEDFYYIPRKSSAVYYQRMFDEDSGAERYRAIDKDLLRVYLRSAGFCAKVRDGERISELDKAMILIREKNVVECAAPYLYYKPGRIFDRALDPDGHVLNISTIRTVKPEMTPDLFVAGANFENAQAYKSFPFLYRLLVSLFVESKEEYRDWEASGQTYAGTANTQFCVFLSWLSHFYKNAYRNTPSCGQAMYLVGPGGCGKTFLASHIIPALMGGRAAAGEQYFLYNGNFTKEISSCPVIVLDDVIPASEYAARVSATQKIKSFVASSTLKYEAKGQDAVTVPFRGRLMCTSNNTERDMTVLPTIDATTEDKFTILSVGKAGFAPGELEFITAQSREATMSIVLSELPAFARFLLEWETPADLVDARWGVVGYQDPSVVREATVTSATVAVFLEVLSNLMVNDILPASTKAESKAFDLDSDEGRAKLAEHLRDLISSACLPPMRITALRLLNRLQKIDPVAMRSFSAAQVQYALTQVASAPLFADIVQQASNSAKRTWSIDYRFLFAYNQDNFEELNYAPPTV